MRHRDLDPYAWNDARRRGPRVGVDAMCWLDGAGAMAVDLSPEGLRLERPFAAYVAHERVQLELELPEVDDVVWLGGEVCFDRRRGAVQSTGVRVIAAAARDLRRIRDYVLERARRARTDHAYDLTAAGCYLRG